MIISKQIKLNNFLSHKDTTLEFKDGTKLLLDGKSGSGKSSIVEGLIWALYGQARVENRNLVKHGTKTGSVTINLFNDLDETYYEIERKTTDKAKNTLQVTSSKDGVNFEPISRNGLKDTQDWIERELLHASYTLFINSIAYPQSNQESFVHQTATKRKDLLLEIANVANFDMYYTRARDMLTLKNEEKIRETSGIESALRFIESERESIVDEDKINIEIAYVDTSLHGYQIQIDAFKKERDSIDEIKSLFSKLNEKILQKNNECISVDNSIIKKLDAIKVIKDINIKDIKDKINELDVLNKRKTELEVLIRADYDRTCKLNAIMADRPTDRDYDGEIMEINKRLIPLVTDSCKCPAGDKCPFIIPIQNQIKYLEGEINEKIGKKAQLQKDKDAYSQKLSEIGPSTLPSGANEEYDLLKIKTASYDVLTTQLGRAQAQIDSLPTLEAELSELKNRYSILLKEHDGLKLEVDGLASKIDENRLIELVRENNKIVSDMCELNIRKDKLNSVITLSRNAQKNIEKMEIGIGHSKKRIKEIDIVIEELTMIKEAFGSKGLKTVVIDYLIPRLEDKINEILSKLSDFRVRLDTQKGTADGEGIIEGLFINIFNERGEQFDYANYSGGESLKIRVAISEALASLQKCGFRIFDELFIGLDEDSIEHFADVMNQLQEKFKQMLCISHLRTIKDLFDERVEITKINGTSQVLK